MWKRHFTIINDLLYFEYEIRLKIKYVQKHLHTTSVIHQIDVDKTLTFLF